MPAWTAHDNTSTGTIAEEADERLGGADLDRGKCDHRDRS